VTAARVVDQTGAAGGELELSPAIFGAPVNTAVMHQALIRQLANARQGTHDTKTRTEVRGGGKKPWRQKGTGRARQGSIRAPQWTGGGIAHGPQPRSHDLRVNKKMKRGALRSALSDALGSGKLAIVDGLEFDEPKTKRAAEILAALDLRGRVLLVLPGPTDDGAVERSFRNLPEIRMAYARSLGVYEVLAADRVLFTQAALDALEGNPVVAEARPAEEFTAEPAGPGSDTAEEPGGSGGSGPPTAEGEAE
jgi:large subunit ribosomal protein L4